MNIYFVRTSIWRLNRSFRHVLDAKNYVRQLTKQRHYKNLVPTLLINGNSLTNKIIRVAEQAISQYTGALH